MKRIVSRLIVIGLVMSFVSCKKYDNGGLISKADKRLTANTWQLDKYLRNGIDETSQLLVSGVTETYAEGGVLTRSYTDPLGVAITETGTWAFDADKLKISLTGIGSMELTNQTSTVSTSRYVVTKLKKKEYWHMYDNGGDTHEFHFIPK